MLKNLKFLIQIFGLRFIASATHASMNTGAGIVVGRPSNFWLFTNRDGFDLTHPTLSSALKVYPRISLQTKTAQVTIAPAKTALMIIDMQNYFLSAAMGRPKSEGHTAEEVLLKYGIPAARQAGIQILWLTWGISNKDLQTLPSTI